MSRKKQATTYLTSIQKGFPMRTCLVVALLTTSSALIAQPQQGPGASLRGGSLLSFEFVCIVERRGGLVYTAMPNGHQPATDFTMTPIEGQIGHLRESGA